MKKTCEVCGKPSGMYPLCTDCFKLRDEGKIIKCEECGIWHKIDEACDCEIEEDNSSECIICGEESNGYVFCKDCYYKYKNKTLILQVKNCKTFEVLDAGYSSEYTCIDGHFVKSKSELLIDNYLYNKGIQHAYEKALPIDKDNSLHPDFYIKELINSKGEVIKDIYLEHWGYEPEENSKYEETKKYKLEKYKELKITLITTNEQDMKNCDAVLERKLKFFEANKINE